MHPITIIGTGMAGYTLARELRKVNQEVPICLISDDNADFYSKPMLSNAINAGKKPWQLAMKDRVAMGIELNAEIVPNTRVERIDPTNKILFCGDGERKYSQLVLAVGASQILLPLSGNGANSVLSVNNLNEYARFRDAILEKQRVVILGAGLIGCEFANDLVLGGKNVSVVDLAAWPLGRLLPKEAGQLLQSKLTEAGVQFELANSIVSVDRVENGLRITLSTGKTLETDVLLSSVGLKPNLDLAVSAGLEVGKGIRVNRQLQTSDPNIFALGDCAEIEGLVLPYVLPIMNGAKLLAGNLLGNHNSLHYPAMPVVVKTPACPAVIALPPATVNAECTIEQDETGLSALYRVSGSESIVGFALLGAHTSKRQSLTKDLPAILPA